MALTTALYEKRGIAYLNRDFHMDVLFWNALCTNMGVHPMFLIEIVQRLPIDVGFTDASGLEGGSGLIQMRTVSTTFGVSPG